MSVLGHSLEESLSLQMESMKLEVRMSLQRRRDGSMASAHRLSLGLARNIPRANQREETVLLFFRDGLL